MLFTTVHIGFVCCNFRATTLKTGSEVHSTLLMVERDEFHSEVGGSSTLMIQHHGYGVHSCGLSLC